MSTWHEVVLHGSEKEARAFVSGFLASRPGAADPVRAQHGPRDALARSVPARPAPRRPDRGAAVPDALVHPLGEAVAQAAPGVDLRIERSRVVGGASFHLRAEVFSREIAGRLQAIVRNLPPDVQTSHVSEHEEAHADAKGIEFHAPAHEYVYHLEADVAGTLPGARRTDPRRRLRAGRSRSTRAVVG